VLAFFLFLDLEINIIMRSFELVTEDPKKLKTVITNLVKQTDDVNLLNKVYNALKSNDVVSRLSASISREADSGKFLETLTKVVLNTEGTVEEKLEFAENFPKGFINVKTLFSKKKVIYDDFVQSGFPQRVFDNLVPIIKQGVGPGELAFSIMSPKIRFTGQEAGGGDLQVSGIGYVELKAEQVAGGRWINPRKANMSLSTIKEALNTLLGENVPNRINTNNWIQIRDSLIARKIKKPQLNKLCKIVADSTFNKVDNSLYQNALISGSAIDIKKAMLQVGFDNYKAYSGFDGMLIMSVSNRTAQYFTSIEEILPNISASTAYILGPEGEIMPQVKISM